MTHELVQILESKGIVYRKSNNPHEIILFCTSGEHEDNHPSLSFNLQNNYSNVGPVDLKEEPQSF